MDAPLDAGDVPPSDLRRADAVPPAADAVPPGADADDGGPPGCAAEDCGVGGTGGVGGASGGSAGAIGGMGMGGALDGTGGGPGRAGTGGASGTGGAGTAGTGGRGTGGASGTGGAGTGGAGTGGAGTGGAPGTGGAAPSGTGGAGGSPSLSLWPGENAAVTVDEVEQFSGNLSGLIYQPGSQPASSGAPDVLWGVQNKPSTLYRLLFNGSTWASTTTDDWTAGKTLHYPDGTGTPDSEGVTKAELDAPAVYVSTERDGDQGKISRLSVLRFDTGAVGASLDATNEWNLTADLPPVDPNLGLEAITFIPDADLLRDQFIDESTGALYDPSRYPNHGTGIFVVGLEGNGILYAYALDHVGGGFQRLATVGSGHIAVMDLAYDRDIGYLWSYCDNTCANQASVLQIETDPTSPLRGHFRLRRLFDHPSSLPNVNNEGITFAPESECRNGFKAFFWSDDNATNGHSIWRDSIPCGAFF